MSAPDVLERVRLSLAAASTTHGEVGAFHLAKARAAFEQATAELKTIELVLVAREAALARGAA